MEHDYHYLPEQDLPPMSDCSLHPYVSALQGLSEIIRRIESSTSPLERHNYEDVEAFYQDVERWRKNNGEASE